MATEIIILVLPVLHKTAIVAGNKAQIKGLSFSNRTRTIVRVGLPYRSKEIWVKLVTQAQDKVDTRPQVRDKAVIRRQARDRAATRPQVRDKEVGLHRETKELCLRGDLKTFRNCLSIRSLNRVIPFGRILRHFYHRRSRTRTVRIFGRIRWVFSATPKKFYAWCSEILDES